MARKAKYPGFVVDQLPSGATRYRVRVEGSPNRKIRIFCGPGEPGFIAEYTAARMGIPPNRPTEDVRGSLKWLVDKYLTHLEAEFERGKIKPPTIKKARLYLGRLASSSGHRPAVLERATLVQIRDALGDRPAMANDTITRVRQMYAWAAEYGLIPDHVPNPAETVKRLSEKRTGAAPWTMGDVDRYCQRHADGTTARNLLTLLVFTGCRIGDAVWLGVDQEIDVDVPVPGVSLQWSTQKTGTVCTVPMAGPLVAAVAPLRAPGLPYIRTSRGAPFATADSLGQLFRRWCREAGLVDRSAHGVRKMVAGLAAGDGASAYGLAAMLGHSSTKTTEIYTRSFDRQIAAAAAAAKINVQM